MAYRKHLFFCTNQREGGRNCCNNKGACELRAYARSRLLKLGLIDPDKIRVNAAGCLGHCAEGPALVIYPEGTWYSYHNEADIDEIIDQHIVNGQIVERLLMEKEAGSPPAGK